MMRNVLIATVILLVYASPGWTLEWMAVFNHTEHLEEYTQDEPCITCHLQGAKHIRPNRKVCAECHDDEEFIQSVKLPPLKTHGPTWLQTHRQNAYQNEALCANCHQTSFCNNCHATRVELKPSLKNQTETYRQMPHRGNYLSRHRIDGRIDPTSCFRCHGNPKAAKTCAPCHG